MLTAAQCRAKAAAALERAEEAPNEVVRQMFVSHACEWTELSRAAEAQDRLVAELSRPDVPHARGEADELRPDAAVSSFDLGTSTPGRAS